jgi:hypothetical protein
MNKTSHTQVIIGDLARVDLGKNIVFTPEQFTSTVSLIREISGETLLFILLFTLIKHF